jgi:hypothetical protein
VFGVDYIFNNAEAVLNNSTSVQLKNHFSLIKTISMVNHESLQVADYLQNSALPIEANPVSIPIKMQILLLSKNAGIIFLCWTGKVCAANAI